MKALDTFLAEQNLDEVQITAADYQAMQRALHNLANAPSFGGFGGPANFIHPDLFDLYLNEIQQQESQNSERMTLIEWLILLWILKQWQESNNNLKPDPEPDVQNEFSLDYGDSLDRISAALFTGENDQPQPTKKNSPRLGR